MKSFNQKLVKKSLKLDKWLRIILFFLETKRKPKKDKVNSILIFEFHLLGDVVMLSSLLLEVRRHHPSAHIGLVAGPWARDILTNHPGVYDSFYSIKAPWVSRNYGLKSLWRLAACIFDLRKISWDLGIETRGDLRQILMLRLLKVQRRIGYAFTGGGWLLTDVVPDDGNPKHLVEHHLQIIRYMHPDFIKKRLTPKLWLSNREKIEIKDSSSRVGLHFGASSSLRRLPESKSIELLHILLSKFDDPIFLFKTPEIHDLVLSVYNSLDSDLKSRVTICSAPLRQFCVEIAKCSLFVGMDSAGGHIAAALNVPVWSIFGPAMAVYCQPIGKNVKIISLEDKKVTCRPCDQSICTHVEHHFCMKMIKFDVFI